MSYTCNIENRDLIIIIAESVNRGKVSSNFDQFCINSKDRIKLLAFCVNSDNYTFGYRAIEEDKTIKFNDIKFTESIFNINLDISLYGIINVYGDCSNDYYYDFLKEMKSNEYLKDVTYSCFYMENFDRMFRYFKPEKHHFLVIRGIKREKISIDFDRFLRNIACNKIVIDFVEYKNWKGTVILISDGKIVNKKFKYKELDRGSYTPCVKLNEYLISTSVLYDNKLKLNSLGIKNPMLSEILTIVELNYDYTIF